MSEIQHLQIQKESIPMTYNMRVCFMTGQSLLTLGKTIYMCVYNLYFSAYLLHIASKLIDCYRIQVIVASAA